MTMRGDRRFGGITIGGILVIIGIVVALVWSILLGVIIAIIGLVAFGGFARGKWYLSPRRGALATEKPRNVRHDTATARLGRRDGG